LDLLTPWSLDILDFGRWTIDSAAAVVAPNDLGTSNLSGSAAPSFSCRWQTQKKAFKRRLRTFQRAAKYWSMRDYSTSAIN
jgi:hypothetical protein